MNDLEERARRAIDAARVGHDPDAADAVRVRAALKARVLAEPLLIQPVAAPVAGTSGVLGKLAIALGVASTLGFAAGLYAAQLLGPEVLTRPSETSAPVAVPSVTSEASAMAEAASAGGLASATPTEKAGTASSEIGSVSHTATAKTEGAPLPPRVLQRRTASSSAGTGSVSPIKAELDGLRRAQELLHRGRAAWALARLDELDRAAVGSVLLEERGATRAIAECQLGADGAAKADAYARRFPDSAHLERVRSSCATAAARAGTPTPHAGTVSPRIAPTQTESDGSQHEE